ncbi:MAG: YIP1 family protein [Actinomycetota bacterium]
MEPIIARVKRALKLEAGVYQEIGNDQKATQQAIVVTIAASLIGGLGSLLGPGTFRFGGWLFGGIFSVLGLAIGTGVLWLVSRLFQGTGEYINLFRSLGYATAPQALGIIPIIGGIVGAVWSIVLAIRAVKETQNVTDGASAATVLIPVVIGLVIGLILAAVIGFALFGLMREASNS